MQPQAPFFTNDWVGILKLISVFGGLAFTIWLAFWKTLQAPFRAEISKVADDLNKVGDRVNVVEKTQERHDERMDRVERDSDKLKQQHEFLMKELGRLESDVRASIEESRESRKERQHDVGELQRTMAGVQKELEIGGRLLGDMVKQRSREHE